jgi:hypothetical protein
VCLRFKLGEETIELRSSIIVAVVFKVSALSVLQMSTDEGSKFLELRSNNFAPMSTELGEGLSYRSGSCCKRLVEGWLLIL